jgi:hypothetical protein
MVLMLDEAKTLVDFKYYNAFRWVLDNVVEQAWTFDSNDHDEPLPFMAIFLGTNSKVVDFLPPALDSSYRYFESYMKIPQPFTALDWDVYVSEPYRVPVPYNDTQIIRMETDEPSNNLTYNRLAEMSWLSRFGRPIWNAHWSKMGKGEQAISRRAEAQRIIRFAEKKLHHCDSKGGFTNLIKRYVNFPHQERRPNASEDFIQTCSAILAVLVGLEFDLTAPKRAADLVASRLRWAAGCDHNRSYLLTTYPSEPILAEAAFQLFFSEVDGKPGGKVSVTIIEVAAKELEKGDYDIGGDGELAAKLMCKTH